MVNSDTIYSEYYIELVYVCNIDPHDTITTNIDGGDNYELACKQFETIVNNREDYFDPGTEPSVYTASGSSEHWYIAKYILIGIFLKGIKHDEPGVLEEITVRDILKYSHIHMW